MSLFSALDASANALSAFQNALTISQNNINNSSTAGYARQSPSFEALPFEQGTGETGGVALGQNIDSRNQFAESNVQSATSGLGYSQQQAQSLTSLQNSFDISGTTGVPAALSGLYTAFSAWSNSANSSTSQQNVLTAAKNVASAFNTTAQQVSSLAASTDTSLGSVTTEINRLAAQLSNYNAQILAGTGKDPGIQAGFYQTLQSLSELVNVTTINAPDGTMTVLLGGGQTSLVSGTKANTLSLAIYVQPPATNPSGPPTAHITDTTGRDISSQLTGGSLGGLLNVRNQVLPGIQGSASQSGSLNDLAKTFADRVNTLLTSGIVSSGPPVVHGSPLYTYDAANPTNSAASLQVASGFTTANLAASDGATSNGTALSLADLSSTTNAASQINGQTYTSYFGSIAASVGSQLSNAKTDQSSAQDSLTQAETFRQQASGVDLNQEAAQILQFQSAYTAASKVVTVIDQMTQTVLALIAPAA